MEFIETVEAPEDVYDSEWNPYTLVTKVENREMKKKFAKDLEKVVPKMEAINRMFLSQLFHPDFAHYSYKELYNWYLLEWQNLCNWFNSRKEKTLFLNPRYFCTLYKPKEQFYGDTE